MPASAPRIPWPLVSALVSLDGPDRPIAEIWRSACALAEAEGFVNPSYEQIRRLVNRQRRVRALPGPGGPLVDGWLRARSPQSAVEEAFRRAGERQAARSRLEEEHAWRPTGDWPADSARPTAPESARSRGTTKPA